MSVTTKIATALAISASIVGTANAQGKIYGAPATAVGSPVLAQISTSLRIAGDFFGPAVPSSHGGDSLRPCFHLRLPCSQPRLAGTRANRPATSGDRPAAAASRSAAAFITRPAPVDLALPDLAAGH